LLKTHFSILLKNILPISNKSFLLFSLFISFFPKKSIFNFFSFLIQNNNNSEFFVFLFNQNAQTQNFFFHIHHSGKRNTVSHLSINFFDNSKVCSNSHSLFSICAG